MTIKSKNKSNKNKFCFSHHRRLNLAGVKRKKSFNSFSKKGGEILLFNRQATLLLTWVLSQTECSRFLKKPILRYIDKINNISKSRGIKFALSYNKSVRTSFIRFLGQYQSQIIDRDKVKGIRSNQLGLPYHMIETWRRITNLSPRELEPELFRSNIQLVVTMLSFPRSLRLPIDPNLETITSPSNSDLDPRSFRFSITKFLQDLTLKSRGILSNGKFRKRPEWKAYHLSTKTGPSGQQALAGCFSDMFNIPVHIQSRLRKLGGKRFCNNFDRMVDFNLELASLMNADVRRNKPYRKLSMLADSEGKTRVVAIGDYWSQTVLRPLHDMTYELLRTISSDQTFNQSKGIGSSLLGKVCFCFDLTAFTDRFPITLVKVLLSELVDSSYAEAWNNVMVGYSFDYKGSKYSYSVGNPMGFYTSWGLTTLAHHFVVYNAGSKIGMSYKRILKNYRLLGDDIIILDERLAKSYRAVINSLGVEISEPKTLISKDILEFAKRLFIPEGEISAISAKALQEHSKNYVALIEFMYTLNSRGLRISDDVQSAAVSYYFLRNKIRSRDRNRIMSRITEAHLTYKVLNGMLNYNSYVNFHLNKLGKPLLGCNHTNIGKSILNMVTVTLFADSSAKFAGDHQDRLFSALLALSSTTAIVTSNRSHPGLSYFLTPDQATIVAQKDITDLIYSCPYAYIVGHFIEEAYIKAMNDAYILDTTEKGEWTLDFRVLVGADCNAILRDRSYVLISRVSNLFSKKLLEHLNMLDYY